MEVKELHEKVLYPVVRVRSTKAGGSGTIIYSKPSKKKESEYQTFVLTNHHVIEDSISVKEEWDSLVKKDIKKEVTDNVVVEVFDYINLSEINSTNSYRASIVAYDKAHDMAILKLESPKQQPYVANLVRQGQIKNIKLFSPILGCGCSLLHDPFATDGRVTSLNEVIENKKFFMTSQNSIFGNSGGAVFLAETGEQIGVTARVTTIQLGFGVDVLTWMGFSIAPDRIYEFIDQQELKFLYDPKDTYEAALERRSKKEHKAKLEMAKETNVELE